MRCVTRLTFVVLLSASALLAGPIFVEKKEVCAETGSLAGLERLRLDVYEVGRLLQRAGLRRGSIKRIFRETFEESGSFKVVDDPKAPRCVLRIFADHDDRYPGLLSVSLVIAVHQKVLLHRLDLETTVPTITITDTVLTSEEEAFVNISEKIRLCTRFLDKLTREATAEG